MRRVHHSIYFAISHCWVEFSWETLCVKSMIFLGSLKSPKCEIDAVLKENKCRERQNKFPGILKLQDFSEKEMLSIEKKP